MGRSKNHKRAFHSIALLPDNGYAKAAQTIRGVPMSALGQKRTSQRIRLNVRFTSESGHRNRPAYYLRRNSSGSFAIALDPMAGCINLLYGGSFCSSGNAA